MIHLNIYSLYICYILWVGLTQLGFLVGGVIRPIRELCSDHQSLSCIPCHPSCTLSLIGSFNFPLSSSTYNYICIYLVSKCPTSSTSPPLQFLHILSSLLKPRHLLVSTANSAAPPLNFTNLILLVLPLTIIQRPSHSFSISLPVKSNLGCFCASCLHTPLTPLQASKLSSLPHRQISQCL